MGFSTLFCRRGNLLQNVPDDLFRCVLLFLDVQTLSHLRFLSKRPNCFSDRIATFRVPPLSFPKPRSSTRVDKADACLAVTVLDDLVAVLVVDCRACSPFAAQLRNQRLPWHDVVCQKSLVLDSVILEGLACPDFGANLIPVFRSVRRVGWILPHHKDTSVRSVDVRANVFSAAVPAATDLEVVLNPLVERVFLFDRWPQRGLRWHLLAPGGSGLESIVFFGSVYDQLRAKRNESHCRTKRDSKSCVASRPLHPNNEDNWTGISQTRLSIAFQPLQTKRLLLSTNVDPKSVSVNASPLLVAVDSPKPRPCSGFRMNLLGIPFWLWKFSVAEPAR